MVEPFTLTILGITYTFSNVCLAILATSAATSVLVTVGGISYYNIRKYINYNYNNFCKRTYSLNSSSQEVTRAYWNMIFCLSYFSKQPHVKQTIRIGTQNEPIVDILVCADILCLSDEAGGYFTNWGRKKVRIYYDGETNNIIMLCKYGSQVDSFETLFSKTDFIKNDKPDIMYVGAESP